jgi:hypothetical protein
MVLLSRANSVVVNNEKNLIMINLEDKNFYCDHCKRFLDLNGKAFMCEISKKVYCEYCMFDWDWACPDRLKRSEHLEYVGYLTLQVSK